MNKDLFYRTIENPSTLDAGTLPKIEEVMHVYPFFQAGWMLMLKNMHLTGNIRFAGELKRAAVHVNNREALHRLIAAPSAKAETPTTPTAEPPAPTIAPQPAADYFADVPDTDLDELDQQLRAEAQPATEYVIDDTDTQIDTTAMHPFGTWLDYVNNKTTAADKHKGHRPHSYDLIDSFLSKTDTHLPQSGKQTLTDYDIEQSIDNSTRENDDILTETLASIYIKQKQYAKAINIFKKLSLKNPEKSVYFASRIFELEKLNDKK